jgi:hypothetical protein
MRTARLVCAAALAAFATFTPPAVADAYDAMLARAVAAKERALDTNDPAGWEDALSLFQQADQIRSTKETKYELGSAAARLRQDDLAVEAYESALALGLEGAARDKARAFVDDNHAQMGRLEVAGPAGAKLWVGPRQRGRLPIGRPLVVFAGENRIRIVHEGRELERQIQVSAGAQERIELAFPADQPASIQPLPPAPAKADPVAIPPPGAGEEPQPSAAGWALLLGGSATAILGGALVVGSTATIDTRRERLAELCAVQSGSDACTTAEPGQRAAAQSEVDAIATWKSVRLGGWVGLGLGAAAAGTGLVLLLDRSAPRPRARVELLPIGGGAALSVHGSL